MPDDALDLDVRDRRAPPRLGAHRDEARHRRSAGREARHLAGSPAGRLLIGAVVAIAIATLAGLIALWPQGDSTPRQVAGTSPTISATVQRVDDVRCPGPAGQRCRDLVVDVNGMSTTLSVGPTATAPAVTAGESIRVSKGPGPNRNTGI